MLANTSPGKVSIRPGPRAATLNVKVRLTDAAEESTSRRAPRRPTNRRAEAPPEAGPRARGSAEQGRLRARRPQPLKQRSAEAKSRERYAPLQSGLPGPRAEAVGHRGGNRRPHLSREFPPRSHRSRPPRRNRSCTHETGDPPRLSLDRFPQPVGRVEPIDPKAFARPPSRHEPGLGPTAGVHPSSRGRGEGCDRQDQSTLSELQGSTRLPAHGRPRTKRQGRRARNSWGAAPRQRRGKSLGRRAGGGAQLPFA